MNGNEPGTPETVGASVSSSPQVETQPSTSAAETVVASTPTEQTTNEAPASNAVDMNSNLSHQLTPEQQQQLSQTAKNTPLNTEMPSSGQTQAEQQKKSGGFFAKFSGLFGGKSK
jgi:hypothetical protein